VAAHGQKADQIEFRWQRDDDLSCIAHSLTAESARMWSVRLAGLIRPATPDPLLGVPEHSVVYQAFGDGKAALVWRLYDEHALPLHDHQARQPLVARALIGGGSLLKSGFTMALCRAEVAATSRLGPPPGQVEIGDVLPSIADAELTRVAGQVVGELDELGGQERGAERLVAAALRNRNTPLSVVLPGRELIRGLWDCPQLLMLWVLWRTTAALTAEPEASPATERDWSFSTYEPPLGITDTSGLANIVFRSQEQEQDRPPPQAARREITVRPRSDAASTDRLDEIATVLIGAYRDLGGEELRNRVGKIADRCPDVDARLDASLRELSRLKLGPVQPDARLDAVRAAPGQRSPLPADEAADSFPPEPGPATSLEPPTPAKFEPASASGPAAPMPEPPYTDLAPAEQGYTASATVNDGLTGQPRERDRTGPQHQGRRGHPWTVTTMLDRINDGPDHPDFELALEMMAKAGFSPPQERAQARNLMPGRTWYLLALRRRDPFQVEDALEAIFRVTVIPDLATAAVGIQLARWAAESPPEVIRALSAAAHHHGGNAVHLLDQVLQSALHRRWLVEHSIHLDHTSPEVGTHVQGGRRRPRPRWQIIPDGSRTGVIASLLAWLCLSLMVALILGTVL
jgi:hypothetical protein